MINYNKNFWFEDLHSSLNRQMNVMDAITKFPASLSAMENSFIRKNAVTPDFFNAVFGSSTQHLLFDANKFQTKIFDPALGIQNIISNHSNLYNKQISIIEKLANPFAHFFDAKPKFIDQFSDSNFVKGKKLTAFDINSGATFLNMLSKFEEEADVEEAYDEIQLILENSALKDEIISLQTKLFTLQEKSVSDSQKIHETKVYFEWFLNKVLINKFSINSVIATVIMWLVFNSIDIIKDIVIEAKGADIYEFVVGVQNNSTNQKDTVYVEPKPVDFTIRKTTVYQRKSDKTKSLGYLPQGTDVTILKITNRWCFIEGEVTVNKKAIDEKNIQPATKLVKGWVKKSNLDMFQ